MSDRVLRGTRLGSVSYESDRHTEFAPRQRTVYDCANGHETAMPFAAEAEIPFSWECRVCGATAQLRDATAPEEKKGKPARTHWDMLLERRSTAELEEVLAERTDFADLLAEEQAQISPDDLVYFSHWITPEGLPIRFDTHFFLAELPESQEASHYPGEMAGGLWLAPAEGLRRHARGEFRIP
ncbi:MAG: RNA polymerase-binding protein RbpA [Actinobacteria bacterium]|nr:RNA polymerase-binding protein RbpA [Actinomycetota bacterium]